MLFLAVVEISATRPAAEVAQEIVEQYDVVARLLKAEKKSGYQVEKLLEAASSETKSAKRTSR
jgi:hypothetical protein